MAVVRCERVYARLATSASLGIADDAAYGELATARGIVATRYKSCSTPWCGTSEHAADDADHAECAAALERCGCRQPARQTGGNAAARASHPDAMHPTCSMRRAACNRHHAPANMQRTRAFQNSAVASCGNLACALVPRMRTCCTHMLRTRAQGQGIGSV